MTKFGGQKSRDADLVRKGGNALYDLNDTIDGVYDLTKKEKSLMVRLDNSVPHIDRVSKRGFHNSIYKKDIAPDNTDNLKVA